MYFCDGHNRRIEKVVRDPSSAQVYRERYIYQYQLEPVAMQRWDATDTLVATRYFVYGLVSHVPARRVAAALGPSRGVPEAVERRPGAAGDAQALSRTTERTIRGLRGRLRRRESNAAARQMLDESGNRFALVTDQVGSVRQVVEVSTGAVVQSMRYTAFGEVLEDEDFSADFPPQPFGYAGGLYDRETGFVRFGARDYDAATRRWTAKDPIRFGGGDTNLFAYVFNDPLKHSDPTGLDVCRCWRPLDISDVTWGEALAHVAFSFIGGVAGLVGIRDIQVRHEYIGVIGPASGTYGYFDQSAVRRGGENLIEDIALNRCEQVRCPREPDLVRYLESSTITSPPGWGGSDYNPATNNCQNFVSQALGSYCE